MMSDVRYAVRMLFKSPAFAIVAIIALGLGMAAALSAFRATGFAAGEIARAIRVRIRLGELHELS